jgi:hypothetical protein
LEAGKPHRSLLPGLYGKPVRFDPFLAQSGAKPSPPGQTNLRPDTRGGRDLLTEAVSLLAAGEPFRVEQPLDDLNLVLAADFAEATIAGRDPDRERTTEPPTLSGHSTSS